LKAASLVPVVMDETDEEQHPELAGSLAVVVLLLPMYRAHAW
jgi:hypothetical protein